MPITPVYGFHFEDEDDQPGISLTGGAAGTELILAEQVEEELQNVQTQVTNIDDRVGVIEEQGVPGWTYIAKGNNTGPAFNIDVTRGGVFSAGTFDLIRIHMRFELDVVGGWVVGRPNNDQTAGRYRSGSLIWGADGSLKESFYNGSTSGWRVGHGDTGGTNNLILEIFSTNGDSLLNFQGTSTRMAGNSATMRWNQHWGDLNEGVGAPMSFFRMSASIGANTFDNAWWWVEGFRAP